MGTVEISGLRIGYQRAGQGPPLVLLHGAYQHSRVWRPQLEGLSNDFTVIAWDAPGCGHSDDPPPDFSGPELGDALAGFLREVSPRKPHVLGLSWGSGIALELYRATPTWWSPWCWPPPTLAGPDRCRLKRWNGGTRRFWRNSTSRPNNSSRALLSASGHADYRDVLPAIGVPTLLLYGAEDVRSPLTVAR